MNNIADIFKNKNLKLTPQRIAVYKYLKSTKSHPTAEIIYNSIKEDYPTMSLATVYKTLKILIKVNLVQELNVGEDNFRYDANVNPHPHIQCINCSKVDDIEDISFAGLTEKIKDFTDYHVFSNQVYFYGICKHCQNNTTK